MEGGSTGSSLITAQDRAEVDDDKVFLFSGSQRLVLLEKDRCECGGGGWDEDIDRDPPGRKEHS